MYVHTVSMYINCVLCDLFAVMVWIVYPELSTESQSGPVYQATHVWLVGEGLWVGEGSALSTLRATANIVVEMYYVWLQALHMRRL